MINQALEETGVEIILDPIRINYIPSQAQLMEIEDKVAALS